MRSPAVPVSAAYVVSLAQAGPLAWRAPRSESTLPLLTVLADMTSLATSALFLSTLSFFSLATR